jgi:hypothetical protein
MIVKLFEHRLNQPLHTYYIGTTYIFIYYVNTYYVFYTHGGKAFSSCVFLPGILRDYSDHVYMCMYVPCHKSCPLFAFEIVEKLDTFYGRIG